MLKTVFETRCSKIDFVKKEDNVYFHYELVYEDSNPKQEFLVDWDEKYGTDLRKHLATDDIRWKSIALRVEYTNLRVTFGAYELDSNMVAVKINRKVNKDGTETFKYTMVFHMDKAPDNVGTFANLYLNNKVTNEEGKSIFALERTEINDINDLEK